MKLLYLTHQNTINSVCEGKLPAHINAMINSKVNATIKSKDIKAQQVKKIEHHATLSLHLTAIKDFTTKDGDVHPATMQNRVEDTNKEKRTDANGKTILIRKVNSASRPVDKDSPAYWKLPTREPRDFTPKEKSLMDDRKTEHLKRYKELVKYEHQLNPPTEVDGSFIRKEKQLFRIGEIPETVKAAEDVDFKVMPLQHGDERIIGRDIEMTTTVNPTHGKILEVSTFDGVEPFSYMTRQKYTGKTKPKGYDGVSLDLCTSFFADRVHKAALVQSAWLTPSDAKDVYQMKGRGWKGINR